MQTQMLKKAPPNILAPRNVYEPGVRQEVVKRLSTRAPIELVERIKLLATLRSLGYRSKVQMLSILMHKFLEVRPWDAEKHGKHAFPIYGSSATKGDEVVAFHIELQPVTVHGVVKSGAETLEEVAQAATSAGVSGASFGLTFLWWIALVVHPDERDQDALQRLKALPKTEVDERFVGFAKRAPRKGRGAE